MKKICYISSDGGHLDEMKQVFRILKDFESFFVTFKSGRLSSRIEGRKVYFLPRIKRNPLRFFAVSLMELIVFLKEKPRIIISSGAGICIPIFIIAKILGAKTVYIETMSRIRKPSITGSIIYRIKPDLFFVQWKHHKKIFPEAVYGGALF